MEIDDQDGNLIKLLKEDPFLGSLKYLPFSAWYSHVPFLKYLISEFEPHKFVELGTHHGLSYFAACETVKDRKLRTKTYAIDNWVGDPHAGYYDDSVFTSVVEHNQEFIDFSTLIRLDFQEAVQNFADASIDLLHIDGAHTYEAVKNDFESWRSKLASDSIVLFHDIHVRRDNFGVYKFWNEIKINEISIEFTNQYGLGVLFLGNTGSKGSFPELIRAWQEQEGENLKGIFGTHGADLVWQYEESLRNELMSSKNQISDLRDELMSSKNQILELSNSNLQQSANLDAVFSSKIWRYTKYLRSIVRFSRELLHLK